MLSSAVFTAGAILLIAVSEPRLFWGNVTGGVTPWYSLLLPVLLLTGAVLLVRMHKWSVPVLATHLVLAFAYSVAKHGGEAVSSVAMAGFGAEGLAVVFGSYLARTGKLR